jgi:enterochelin esterase-like enzyme
MQKHLILNVTLIVLFEFSALAQEAIFRAQQIISPEINEDQSATFRLLAPNAKLVQVTGDFLPTVKMDTQMGPVDAPGKAELVKRENGVWEFKSQTLSPELYNYSFIIDGFTTTDPNNSFLIRDVASVTNIFIIGGGQAEYYKTNNIPHGTVSRLWYDSPGLGIDRRITIYTPPGYESSSEKYPVLYLLHGAGGDEEAWISLGRTAQIMDNLIAHGKAKPMIVVMPNGNVIQDAAPGEGSLGFYKPEFMIPKTMDGTYEASFMDIIKFVESNYRVKAEKSNRAIAGLFSAALMPREDATGKVYSDLDGTLKTQMDNGYKLYWIAIGKTDFLYNANVEYREKLDKMGMKYDYLESEGGHIWRNWREYLTQFAPMLF